MILGQDSFTLKTLKYEGRGFWNSGLWKRGIVSHQGGLLTGVPLYIHKITWDLFTLETLKYEGKGFWNSGLWKRGIVSHRGGLLTGVPLYTHNYAYYFRFIVCLVATLPWRIVSSHSNLSQAFKRHCSVTGSTMLSHLHSGDGAHETKFKMHIYSSRFFLSCAFCIVLSRFTPGY